MKTIKDKFVPDDLWYFVLAYLDRTRYQPIYDRHLEKYDEKTGFPVFTISWLTSDIFEELAHEAVLYYMQKMEDITLENIDKYGDK